MQAEGPPQPEMPAPTPEGERLNSPAVFTSGMIDRQQGWGNRRMMAVLSLIAPHSHQELNAETLLDELADTFFRTPLAEPDRALAQAIEAVQSRLADTSGEDHVAQVGIATVVLDDDHLYLAVTAPCRAALWQDREVLHLPAGGEIEAEQHSNLVVPAIMESELGPGDKLALLATDTPAASREFTSSEALEEAAGPSGSYVWLEVSETPPPPLQAATFDPSEPLPPVPADQIQAAASQQSRVHTTWSSQTSGGPKLLQRPPGSDALHRYRSTGRGGTPSALRARLPRGIPPARFLALSAVVLTLLLVAGYFAVKNRPEQNYPESATPTEYSQAIAAAIEDEDTELVNALLPGAHTLLERAGGDESDTEDAVTLRLQIVAANDFLNSVVRLEHPTRVGIVPESLMGTKLQLIQAAGLIYLLAGDIYAIDEQERLLIALPELLPPEAAGMLIAAGGDISTLAMTSADTSYFFGDAVGGEATVLPDWPSGFDLADTDASVFRSRLYVIDLDSAEIVVIDSEVGQTSLWIQRDSDVLPEGPLGMAIDGEIHVIYANGELYALKEGYVVGKTTLPLTMPVTDPRAIAYDYVSELIYIADAAAPEGRLIAWDNANEETVTFLLGPDAGGHLDGEAHEGFVHMTDLLVSKANGLVYWIADGSIWQAELPELTIGAGLDEEEDATPEAQTSRPGGA